MSLPLRIEHFLRALRDGLFEKALSSRVLRKALYRRLSATGHLVYRRFDDHVLVFDPGDLVGRTILEKGDFDRLRTNAVCRRARGLTNRRAVLEIGANIGTQTVYFTRPQAGFETVISLEPDPRNLELLELNTRLNGLGERVRIIPAAAGAVAGELTLRRDAGNSGGATLRANNLPREVESEVCAPVVAIDDLVRAGVIDPLQIGLVWMDAEGFEEEIFSACTQLTAMRTPMTFEFTPGFYDEAQRKRIIEAVFAWYEDVSIVAGDEFQRLSRADALKLMDRVDLFCC